MTNLCLIFLAVRVGDIWTSRFILAICMKDIFLGRPEPSFLLEMVSGGRFLAFLWSLLTVLRLTSSFLATTCLAIPPWSQAKAKAFFSGLSCFFTIATSDEQLESWRLM